MAVDEENQREWRMLILNKLTSLEGSQSDIKRDISDIKINMPSPKTITDMETRIRGLEEFKTRAQTLFFVIQALGYVIMLLIQHFWK